MGGSRRRKLRARLLPVVALVQHHTERLVAVRQREYDGPGQSSYACYQDTIDHSGGCTAPF
jgi:hypothetical protein